MTEWLDFIFCAVLGWTGIHKFKERKVGIGTLYFLTVGLCGVGWIVDTFWYLVIAVRRTMELRKAQTKRIEHGEELSEIDEPEMLELKFGERCYYEQNAARISSEAVKLEDDGSLIYIGPKMPDVVGRRRSKRINWAKTDEMLGLLYVTDRRVVITDGQENRECPLDQIVAVNLYRNLLLIRMKEQRVYIATDEAVYVYQILAQVCKMVMFK